MPNYFTIDIDGVLTSDDYMSPWPGGRPPWDETPREGMLEVLGELRDTYQLHAIPVTARPQSMWLDTLAWFQHSHLDEVLMWEETRHCPMRQKPEVSSAIGSIAHIDDRPDVLIAYYAAGTDKVCRPIHLDPRGRSASLIPYVVRDPWEMRDALLVRLDEVLRAGWTVHSDPFHT